MSVTQWAQSFLQTAFSCKISSKAYQEPDPHDKQSALQQLSLYSYDYKCLSLSGARRFEGLITLKCGCVCVCSVFSRLSDGSSLFQLGLYFCCFGHWHVVLNKLRFGNVAKLLKRSEKGGETLQFSCAMMVFTDIHTLTFGLPTKLSGSDILT